MAKRDNVQLPFQLMEKAVTFSIKGRGTVLGGLATTEAGLHKGDMIEARLRHKFMVRLKVQAIESILGSSPPPEGFDLIGIMVKEGSIEKGLENLEVWIVDRAVTDTI